MILILNGQFDFIRIFFLTISMVKRDPNLSSMDGSSESKYPAWPAFTTEAEEYKDISVTFQNQAGHPAPKRCHFHQNMLPKLKANEGMLSIAT